MHSFHCATLWPTINFLNLFLNSSLLPFKKGLLDEMKALFEFHNTFWTQINAGFLEMHVELFLTYCSMSFIKVKEQNSQTVWTLGNYLFLPWSMGFILPMYSYCFCPIRTSVITTSKNEVKTLYDCYDFNSVWIFFTCSSVHQVVGIGGKGKGDEKISFLLEW